MPYGIYYTSPRGKSCLSPLCVTTQMAWSLSQIFPWKKSLIKWKNKVSFGDKSSCWLCFFWVITKLFEMHWSWAESSKFCYNTVDSPCYHCNDWYAPVLLCLLNSNAKSLERKKPPSPNFCGTWSFGIEWVSDNNINIYFLSFKSLFDDSLRQGVCYSNF